MNSEYAKTLFECSCPRLFVQRVIVRDRRRIAVGDWVTEIVKAGDVYEFFTRGGKSYTVGPNDLIEYR